MLFLLRKPAAMSLQLEHELDVTLGIVDLATHLIRMHGEQKARQAARHESFLQHIFTLSCSCNIYPYQQ